MEFNVTVEAEFEDLIPPKYLLGWFGGIRQFVNARNADVKDRAGIKALTEDNIDVLENRFRDLRKKLLRSIKAKMNSYVGLKAASIQ